MKTLLAILLATSPLFGQGAGELLPWAQPRFMNGNAPLSLGFVCTLTAGSNTPLATYQDQNLGTPNQNPIRLDSSGMPINGSSPVSIYLGAATYKVILYAAGPLTGTKCNGTNVGAQIRVVDNVANLSLGDSFATKMDDKVCHPSQYTGTTPSNAGGKIAACIAALPGSGGTVDASGLEGAQTISSNIFSGVTKPVKLLLNPGATYTVTATMTAANTLTLECNGATLTKSVAGTLLTLSGTGSYVSGCLFNGTTATLALSSNSGTRIIDNSFQGTTDPAIYGTDTTNFTISRNRIADAENHGIFLENNSKDGSIDHNTIEITDAATPDSDGIQLHSTTSGKTISGVSMEHNLIRSGASAGFCIEVGAFGGENVFGWNISNNTCYATAATFGGYSMDRVTGGTISGNDFYVTSGIPEIGIEIVTSTGVAVTGNSIYGGSSLVKGMTLDRSSGCTVTGNMFYGFSSGGTGRGIHINVSSSSITALAVDNVISNNVIYFPTTGVGVGIYLQSNNASANLSSNIVSNNRIKGNSVSATYGILLDHTLGTMEGIQIMGNNLTGVDFGIDLEGDPHVQTVGNFFASGVNNFTGGGLANLQRMELTEFRIEGDEGGGTNIVKGSSVNALRLSGLQVASTVSPPIQLVASGSAMLNFGNTAAQDKDDKTMTVTGVTVANVGQCALGVTSTTMPATAGAFSCFVSADNTVTVRFVNSSAGAIDPPDSLFTVTVFTF